MPVIGNWASRERGAIDSQHSYRNYLLVFTSIIPVVTVLFSIREFDWVVWGVPLLLCLNQRDLYRAPREAMTFCSLGK